MGWENIKGKTDFFVKQKLFGLGTSMIYDETGKELLIYAKARFMKWHGFKLFTAKDETGELVFSKRDSGEGEGGMARLKKAFSFVYKVSDSETNEEVCGFKRKAFKSMFKDTWIILDKDGGEAGQIVEDSGWTAFLSRISPLFPQKYKFEIGGKLIATLKGKFSFMVPKYVLHIEDETADIRLIMTGTALIAGVEGKQN